MQECFFRKHEVYQLLKPSAIHVFGHGFIVNLMFVLERVLQLASIGWVADSGWPGEGGAALISG